MARWKPSVSGRSASAASAPLPVSFNRRAGHAILRNDRLVIQGPLVVHYSTIRHGQNSRSCHARGAAFPANSGGPPGTLAVLRHLPRCRTHLAPMQPVIRLRSADGAERAGKSGGAASALFGHGRDSARTCIRVRRTVWSRSQVSYPAEQRVGRAKIRTLAVSQEQRNVAQIRNPARFRSMLPPRMRFYIAATQSASRPRALAQKQRYIHRARYSRRHGRRCRRHGWPVLS